VEKSTKPEKGSPTQETEGKQSMTIKEVEYKKDSASRDASDPFSATRQVREWTLIEKGSWRKR
jgi:hypothetical protein